VVTSGGPDEYCAFTKAVEHLADRWSFLIIADLVKCGPLGFNALAAGVPGRISRSVLADRLRRLERLGIVCRDSDAGSGGAYRLTAVGDSLTPTVVSLRDWAGVWLPDDPAAAERDPDLVLAWLTRRIDDAHLPERRTVLELTTRHAREHRGWLVIERGRAPYGCFEDPLLDETRYVYVAAAITVLLALAHGTCGWARALADGSVEASGDPALLEQLPTWFR
jgi:DNA-binding HxlR family transcriptional regulator